MVDYILGHNEKLAFEMRLVIHEYIFQHNIFYYRPATCSLALSFSQNCDVLLVSES